MRPLQATNSPKKYMFLGLCSPVIGCFWGLGFGRMIWKSVSEFTNVVNSFRYFGKTLNNPVNMAGKRSIVSSNSEKAQILAYGFHSLFTHPPPITLRPYSFTIVISSDITRLLTFPARSRSSKVSRVVSVESVPMMNKGRSDTRRLPRTWSDC